MVKFESPLGSQTVPDRPMKHLQVPDESGYMPPPDMPVGGGGFSPSVSRRQGRQMSPEEMQEWQENIQAQMNPDLQLSDEERAFKQAREDKRRGMTNLNEGARKRIEMLIGMTRLIRSVDIDGNIYMLRTLKGKETREAITAAAEFDGTVQSPFEIRKQVLARSITMIAGVPTEQFVGSNSIQAVLNAMDEMDDFLLNRLMDEYNALTTQAREKYAMKTEEEVKEVSEDIKK